MSASVPGRLAVLRSHLLPDGPEPPMVERVRPPAAAVGGAVSTSTCAGSGVAAGGGEDCVFCRIIRGDAPAYKVIRSKVLPVPWHGSGTIGSKSSSKGQLEFASRDHTRALLNPTSQVYEDDVCLCILDSHPLAPGHSLIIPKCHFPSLEATPPPVVAAMCSKVPFFSNAIMKATKCDSFNLVVNNGAAAGQVIFHTHFHIIPRRSGDKLWPTESFRRRSIEPNETSGLVSCIKEQLCSTPESFQAEASSLSKES